MGTPSKKNFQCGKASRYLILKVSSAFNLDALEFSLSALEFFDEREASLTTSRLFVPAAAEFLLLSLVNIVESGVQVVSWRDGIGWGCFVGGVTSSRTRFAELRVAVGSSGSSSLLRFELEPTFCWALVILALMGTWARTGRRGKEAIGRERDKWFENVEDNEEKAGWASLESIAGEPDGSRLQGRTLGYRTPSHAFGPRLSSGSLAQIKQNIVNIHFFFYRVKAHKCTRRRLAGG
jgi:hypothetical protein